MQNMATQTHSQTEELFFPEFEFGANETAFFAPFPNGTIIYQARLGTNTQKEDMR
jgi:hypothetical protein